MRARDRGARAVRETVYAGMDAGVGLVRHLSLTVAVMLVGAVTLSLVGAGVLMGRQVDLIAEQWYEQVRVTVYLCDGLVCDVPTADQVDTLRNDLEADPRVAAVEFETSEQAYENFVELFEDRPELVAATTPDLLPTSFRAQLTSPAVYDDVVGDYQLYDGVDEVSDQRQLVDRLIAVAENVRLGAWIAAAIQAFSALVLLYTAVRISAVSRRAQTRVMKHLGASNRYIRLPFMIEAVVSSLVGAGIAIAVLYFGVQWTTRYAAQFITLPYLTTADVWTIAGQLLVGAAVVGVVTARVSLRKHLRA